jgi:hypothetical protein
LAHEVGLFCFLVPREADGVFEEEVEPFVKGDAAMLVAPEAGLRAGVAVLGCKVWIVLAEPNSQDTGERVDILFCNRSAIAARPLVS